jgi:hypothetical protein
MMPRTRVGVEAELGRLRRRHASDHVRETRHRDRQGAGAGHRRQPTTTVAHVFWPARATDRGGGIWRGGL